MAMKGEKKGNVELMTALTSEGPLACGALPAASNNEKTEQSVSDGIQKASTGKPPKRPKPPKGEAPETMEPPTILEIGPQL